jgi:hypothetical protein
MRHQEAGASDVLRTKDARWETLCGMGGPQLSVRIEAGRKLHGEHKMTELRSILDVPMKCELCGAVTRAGDCEPDVDGDGSLGCPLPDCGGIVREEKPER